MKAKTESLQYWYGNAYMQSTCISKRVINEHKSNTATVLRDPEAACRPRGPAAAGRMGSALSALRRTAPHPHFGAHLQIVRASVRG